MFLLTNFLVIFLLCGIVHGNGLYNPGINVAQNENSFSSAFASAQAGAAASQGLNQGIGVPQLINNGINSGIVNPVVGIQNPGIVDNSYAQAQAQALANAQSGQTGYAPGQTGYAPGQTGYVSGQTGYAPGLVDNSGYTPGLVENTGYAPGLVDNSYSQAFAAAAAQAGETNYPGIYIPQIGNSYSQASAAAFAGSESGIYTPPTTPYHPPYGPGSEVINGPFVLQCRAPLTFIPPLPLPRILSAGDVYTGGYCQSKTCQQSPIHIDTVKVIKQQYQDLLTTLYFAITPTAVTWYNKNRNIYEFFNYTNGVKPSIRGGPLPNTKGSYEFQAKRSKFGIIPNGGTEHCMNSKCWDLEKQCIFYNSELKSYAITASFFEEDKNYKPDGEDNSIFEKVRYDGSSAASTNLEPLEVACGFPNGTLYVTYLGSETSYPCTPNVIWLISVRINRISSERLAGYRALLNSNKTPMAPNIRVLKSTSSEGIAIGSAKQIS